MSFTNATRVARRSRQCTSAAAVLAGLLVLTESEAAADTITTDHASWLAAVAGSLTTVGFDDRTAWTTLSGDEYTASGLTIVQRDEHPLTIATIGGAWLSAQNFNSGTQGLVSSWTTSGASNDAWSDNIDFLFTTPTASAGLWIGNLSLQSQATTVQFLGEGATILASGTFHWDSPGLIGTTWESRLFVGLNSTSASILGIRVVNGANDGDGLVFDDVSFSVASASVPEPATWLLLSWGGMALAWNARRRA